MMKLLTKIAIVILMMLLIVTLNIIMEIVTKINEDKVILLII